MIELIPQDLPAAPGSALVPLPAATSSLRNLIPEHLLVRHRCLPLQVTDNQLVVALPEPHDRVAIDDLGLVTGLDVQPVTVRGFEPVTCDVLAKVSGPVALVEVTQQFVNYFQDVMEGVYSFPFPFGATLHTFEVEAGGSVRRATLRAADEGDELPPLVVERSHDRLHAELGLLPAAEAVRVRLRYFERLETSLCETVLRLPALPAMHATVELETGGRPLSRLACSEPVERSQPDQDRCQLRLVTDQGCVLRFGFQGPELSASLLVRDEHFLLTVTPPLQLARPAQPRDVAVVIDRSARMEGERWSQALTALGRLLAALEPGDRVRAFVFNDSVCGFRDGQPVKPDDVAELERFLRGLRPSGPDSALQRAVELAWAPAEERGRQSYLVLIGSPGDRCLDWSRPERRFLGLGHTGADLPYLAPFGPCAALDDPLAVNRLVRELGAPVLTDVQLVDRGLNFMTEGLEPSPLPDLSSSRPLFVSGWKLGQGALEVRGTLPTGERWSQLVTPVTSHNEAVRLAWAVERLRTLEGRRGTDGEVVKLSRQYGLPSRLTRFMLAGGSPGAFPGEESVTADDPRIVRVVNLIISQAIKDRATHVHYEQIVRYRVDGVLREVMTPPEWVRAAIVERIKKMCGIEGTGAGSFSLTHDGRPYDVHASVVPTATGEKVTLQIATSPPAAPALPEPIQQLLGLEGLLLVSRNLLPAVIAHHTAEDRHLVVYGSDLQMGEGPTYLTGRTRLALDADVLVADAFCDEMLDVPRAVAGIPSPDLELTLVRLQSHKDIFTRLRGLAAERRLRKSCGCEKGCERCQETGFFGEIRLFEVLWMTDELRAALSGPTSYLLAAARKARLTTFVEQARQAAERGETTFAEVVRVFGADAHRTV